MAQDYYREITGAAVGTTLNNGLQGCSEQDCISYLLPIICAQAESTLSDAAADALYLVKLKSNFIARFKVRE